MEVKPSSRRHLTDPEKTGSAFVAASRKRSLKEFDSEMLCSTVSLRSCLLWSGIETSRSRRLLEMSYLKSEGESGLSCCPRTKKVCRPVSSFGAGYVNSDSS